MRILITGAAGFVGSHATCSLIKEGHQVAALVRPTTNLQNLQSGVSILVHDGSTEQLFDLISAFEPDVSVHLSSKFVAEHRPSDIESLIQSNLMFGCQFLDALSRTKCRRLVNIGTSWEHYESEGYRPVSLYAATKYAFGNLCAFYADSDGLRIITLKLSDTYGPNDTRPKLIPLLNRISRTGETLKLSPGGQSINFTHVDDVVKAIRLAIDRTADLKHGVMESFAVRGAERITLREFVNLFEAVAGQPVNVIWGARPYRRREVMEPWLGNVLPGWRQSITLKQGLQMMLADD